VGSAVSSDRSYNSLRPTGSHSGTYQERTQNTVQKATLVVQHKVGLHARPAALFVQTAQRFNADILVTKDGRQVSAKSILSILTLGAQQGAIISVQATGDDEEAAVQAIAELVRTNFGEPRE
jgi:phosphocarrier protein HPr